MHALIEYGFDPELPNGQGRRRGARRWPVSGCAQGMDRPDIPPAARGANRLKPTGNPVGYGGWGQTREFVYGIAQYLWVHASDRDLGGS